MPPRTPHVVSPHPFIFCVHDGPFCRGTTFPSLSTATQAAGDRRDVHVPEEVDDNCVRIPLDLTISSPDFIVLHEDVHDMIRNCWFVRNPAGAVMFWWPAHLDTACWLADWICGHRSVPTSLPSQWKRVAATSPHSMRISDFEPAMDVSVWESAVSQSRWSLPVLHTRAVPPLHLTTWTPAEALPWVASLSVQTKLAILPHTTRWDSKETARVLFALVVNGQLTHFKLRAPHALIVARRDALIQHIKALGGSYKAGDTDFDWDAERYVPSGFTRLPTAPPRRTFGKLPSRYLQGAIVPHDSKGMYAYGERLGNYAQCEQALFDAHADWGHIPNRVWMELAPTPMQMSVGDSTCLLPNDPDLLLHVFDYLWVDDGVGPRNAHPGSRFAYCAEWVVWYYLRPLFSTDLAYWHSVSVHPKDRTAWVLTDIRVHVWWPTQRTNWPTLPNDDDMEGPAVVAALTLLFQTRTPVPTQYVSLHQAVEIGKRNKVL